MNTEQASGRHPPKAKNVIPITDSGMKKVCPKKVNYVVYKLRQISRHSSNY